MRGRRFPLAPAEGWFTLILVVILSMTLAASIDDVALVLGREDFTDFLLPMAIAGTLMGFIGAKVGWGRWLTYLIGSTFAALIVPLLVGGILRDVGTPFQMFEETARSLVQAGTDLIVLDLGLTREFGHYLWVLGLLVWATAMFTASVTFQGRRPLNGIVVIGLVLLVNMALTFKDQLGYLVIFSAASLLLLVRYHVLDEQSEWIRRRIGDPASISGLYLRGGTVFIAVAVAGSVLLTEVARSAPLQGAFTGVGSSLVELSRSIQAFLPQGGSSRTFGADFDPSGTTIAGVWNPGNDLELTVRVAPGDTNPYYWRAVTYDEFTGNRWQTSADLVTALPRAAGEELLEGTGDAVDPETTRAVTFTVVPGRQRTIVFSPLTPSEVDRPTTVNVLGENGRLATVMLRDPGSYTVTALLPVAGTEPGELNKSVLRAAGQDYPEDIESLYTQVPAIAMPSDGNAEKLLAALVAEVEVDGVVNPYDFADLLETRFRASGPDDLFVYDANVLDLLANECRNLSTVECFATYRRGFCQYYATTMAIFLRAEGIPARVVQGFLPSDRDRTGQEVVTNSRSHQWVEAYFPGIGWYTFDPTGGGLAQTVTLPVGEPVASATPRPSTSAVPIIRDPGGPDIDPRTGQPIVPAGASGPGPFIAIGGLLAAIMGILVFLAWQRGPRGETSPDRAYRTVTALAGRFGFGPRPNQTVYEYASTLGEVLPIARPELETVAHAKVETVYGRTLLGEDRLRSLRLAERRLRLSLLRLAFRRGRRR